MRIDCAGLDELISNQPRVTVRAGDAVFRSGERCKRFAAIRSGAVRVSRAFANGRRIELYRLAAGDSCALTIAALLEKETHRADAFADGDVELSLVPAAAFDDLMARHAFFRAFVFRGFTERIARLMLLVETVVVQRLDERLAALLVARGPLIDATHQQLADDRGTVREIASRLLDRFADDGLIALGRTRIEILDPIALLRISNRRR